MAFHGETAAVVELSVLRPLPSRHQCRCPHAPVPGSATNLSWRCTTTPNARRRQRQRHQQLEPPPSLPFPLCPHSKAHSKPAKTLLPPWVARETYSRVTFFRSSYFLFSLVSLPEGSELSRIRPVLRPLRRLNVNGIGCVYLLLRRGAEAWPRTGEVESEGEGWRVNSGASGCWASGRSGARGDLRCCSDQTMKHEIGAAWLGGCDGSDCGRSLSVRGTLPPSAPCSRLRTTNIHSIYLTELPLCLLRPRTSLGPLEFHSLRLRPLLLKRHAQLK